MRAHAIFEAKGVVKSLKEVKSKLKMLSSSVKLAAEMAVQEGIESGGDESPKGSPGEGRSKSKGKKQKQVITKKKKKTVFRNNFVNSGDK